MYILDIPLDILSIIFIDYLGVEECIRIEIDNYGIGKENLELLIKKVLSTVKVIDNKRRK